MEVGCGNRLAYSAFAGFRVGMKSASFQKDARSKVFSGNLKQMAIAADVPKDDCALGHV